MSQAQPKDGAARYTAFESLPIRIEVRVGKVRCRLGELVALAPGDLLRLDRRIGEPFELRGGGVRLAHVEPVAEQGGVAVRLVNVAEDDSDAPG